MAERPRTRGAAAAKKDNIDENDHEAKLQITKDDIPKESWELIMKKEVERKKQMADRNKH